MKKILEFLKKLFCKLGFCCSHKKIELESKPISRKTPDLDEDFND